MSVPKSRKTSSSVRRRRSHHSLKPANVTVCEKCGAPVISHRACAACGYYNGRQVTLASSVVAPAAKAPAKTTKKAADSKEAASEAPQA